MTFWKIGKAAAVVAAFITTPVQAAPIDLLQQVDYFQINAIAEFNPIPLPMVDDNVLINPEPYDLTQIKCMADNVYYEARGEPYLGQVAVNHVVLNRVVSDKFPDTPCKVVGQRNRRGCQFSWKCQRSYPKSNRQAYARAWNVAYDTYYGLVPDITDGAQYYHATYVRPRWASAFRKTTKINTHIFYKDEKWSLN